MIKIINSPAIHFVGCEKCNHKKITYPQGFFMTEIDYCADCAIENEKAKDIFPAYNKILPKELIVRFVNGHPKFFDETGFEFERRER